MKTKTVALECSHMDDEKRGACDNCLHPLTARPIKQTVLRFARKRSGKEHHRVPLLLKHAVRANQPERKEAAFGSHVLYNAPHERQYSLV
jgi:hypothetical protein